MGVLTDLVVAPATAAAAVAETGSNERSWPWADVRRFDIVDLAMTHCLIDGRDPNVPVTPPEWVVNPFTKKRMAVTTHNKYAQAMELVAEHGEVVVFRVPAVLVATLARFDSTAAAHLAREWSVAKSSERYGDGTLVTPFGEDVAAAYLGDVVAMARVAAERSDELFVWMCP
jgi:hypothetical protein